MKLKKLALISTTSLMLISTCIPALNATNTTTQTVLAAKNKNNSVLKQTKKVYKVLKKNLYNEDYSGPKPNPKTEKLLKKIAKNARYADDVYNVYFKAKRNTIGYYDATDYDNYDENGDPIKPNQLGIKKVKKGEELNVFDPTIMQTNKPFLGRNIFKNKTILVSQFNEDVDEEDDPLYYFNMKDFKILKHK